ncbi:hypothetical protein PRNP1_013232 [Phytophthora ramorum]
MDGAGDNLEQKQVAPLSTVSLDSTYDQDDAGSASAEKRPARNQWSWPLFLLLLGLTLVAVGLVLALDRDDSSHGLVADVGERDLSFSTAYSSSERLDAAQKKLARWLNQMHNASELYVEGASINASLSGVVFPRNGSDTSVPFDAMVAVDSGLAMPSRQFVALANGRGYKWTETQVSYGDSIVSSGCLTANCSLPFHELDSVVSTANWTSDDFDDKVEVNIAFNGANYTVSKDEGDGSSEVEDANCWSIESEDDELGLHVCIPSVSDQILKTDFEEIFEATSGCPQVAPNGTRTSSRLNFSVPLPLRKWYASYKV